MSANITDDTILLKWILKLAQYRQAVIVFNLLVLANLFVGIANIADVFMNSIEFITSRTKKVRRFNTNTKLFECVEVRVWNQTVANLSLMALGNSAPEILLTTIETIGNNFKVGNLGPGSIVGAAMFNTMIITAFCVIVIAGHLTKKIQKIQVFWVTTFFTLAAYVWLYLIVAVISPNVVTIPEAIITISLFPVMLLCSYAVDRFETPNGDSNHNDEERQTVVIERSLCTEWSRQIREAFEYKPGGDTVRKCVWNHVKRFFCFHWRVAFSVICPPVRLAGGWATFLVSVVVIGVLTALVGDLANCVRHEWGMSGHIAGITIVAIGNSLPDLFSSRLAASRENHADNAIGNINGSNAFNVILGLGFPWLVAALYQHWTTGSELVVTNLTGLTFSTQLFWLFSAIHLAILSARRRFLGGELGGQPIIAYTTFAIFISLWLLYVMLSVLNH